MTEQRPAGPSRPAEGPEDVAARWLARKRGGLSVRGRAALTKWLDAAPENQSAFDAAETAWGMSAEAAGDADVRAIRAAALAMSPRPRPWRIALTAASLVAAALAGASAWLVLEGEGAGRGVVAEAPARDMFATAVGERSTVSLGEGSSIVLNTSTRVRVDFTPEERGVTLLSGQALFEVSKDPNRPFVVRAGDKRVIALGTAFDVRMEDGAGVKVTMVEGRAAVETIDMSPRELLRIMRREPPRRVEIVAGERLYAERGEEKIAQVDAERETSWRDGRLVFEGERLAQAVAEVNRYTTTPVVIGHPTLNDLRVSGVFRAGQPKTFVEGLEAYFPVDADRLDDGSIRLTWRR